MVKKIYQNWETVLTKIHMLVQTIKSFQYAPDYLVAISSGGFIPARLLKNDFNVPILSVGYTRDSENNQVSKLAGINSDIPMKDKRILIVDEIEDTGTTLQRVVEDLQKTGAIIEACIVLDRRDIPKPTLPCNLHFASSHKEDYWIVYPWESE